MKRRINLVVEIETTTDADAQNLADEFVQEIGAHRDVISVAWEPGTSERDALLAEASSLEAAGHYSQAAKIYERADDLRDD